jgi:hypothetical protein
MAMKFIDSASADRINCLVIGKPGVGKTYLLSTIPENERVFVLSAEAGLLSVREHVASGRVQGAEIRSLEDLEEALWALSSPKYTERYRWVFLDSLTEISDRCLEFYKAKYPSHKDSWSMWGEYGDRMCRLVKAFRDLREYNVVMTCLESIELDNCKRKVVTLDVQMRRLRERLPAWFDEVFYLVETQDENGNYGRVLFTRPYNNQPGKDRSGKLDFTEPPDLAHIQRKILGGQS